MSKHRHITFASQFAASAWISPGGAKRAKGPILGRFKTCMIIYCSADSIFLPNTLAAETHDTREKEWERRPTIMPNGRENVLVSCCASACSHPEWMYCSGPIGCSSLQWVELRRCKRLVSLFHPTASYDFIWVRHFHGLVYLVLSQLSRITGKEPLLILVSVFETFTAAVSPVKNRCSFSRNTDLLIPGYGSVVKPSWVIKCPHWTSPNH